MKTALWHKLTFFIVILPLTLLAADHIDLVEQGNKALKEKDAKKALEFYHSAETEIPESPELDYNMATALAVDGAYEQAVEKFQRSLNTTDINLEASAHYNLGNTYFWSQDYENAIKSYESCLKINPDDVDAKFNLELARKMLKEQMKPENQEQQQQQQKQDQQEKEKQDQQQQQQQQEQQKQEENKDQDQQQQQEDQNQQQQQQQQQQEQQMSKEDAERILNALRDDEKDIQKKIRRAAASGSYSGKDW